MVYDVICKFRLICAVLPLLDRSLKLQTADFGELMVGIELLFTFDQDNDSCTFRAELHGLLYIIHN